MIELNTRSKLSKLEREALGDVVVTKADLPPLALAKLNELIADINNTGSARFNINRYAHRGSEHWYLSKYLTQTGLAVRCIRPSKLSNKFEMDTEDDRDYVCDQFEHKTLPTLDLSIGFGKVLMCTCKLDKRCHVDSIRKAIEVQYDS